MRVNDGGTRFSYLPEYLARGQTAIASSLPLSAEPVVTGSGSVPPFFTHLLPEDRRLSSLRRAVKASSDNELALRLAVGGGRCGSSCDCQRAGEGLRRNGLGTR
ncbi:HipA N-terminal domain-containing protein [Arthrobacter roseus]|uniref:HipA N-terminal domain-containing protein n=1 Tax=Arthrobacter roseus TaxID=136274 RepID=UPI001EF93374|nr:HipA N-terminal domain-containing protein [Arthrobacter roseus]